MITIIVPVYNGEKVIERCLNSLLEQTYTNFEILVINDGSVDSTENIVNSFDDSRIRLINQNNYGVSAARNYGIEIANGDWIAFVDSDDYVENTYLQTLLSLSDEGVMPVVNFAKNDSNIPVLQDEIEGAYIIGKYMSDDYLIGKLGKTSGFSCWNKLFSKRLLIEKKLRFQPKLKIGEDLVFLFQYLCYCKTVRFNVNVGYHYCDNNDSAIHIAKDQSVIYETTLSVLQNICENGFSFSEISLSKWSLDILTYIIQNQYVTSMNYPQFHIYIKRLKQYKIANFAIKNTLSVGIRKNMMLWALKRKSSLWLFILLQMQIYRKRGIICDKSTKKRV